MEAGKHLAFAKGCILALLGALLLLGVYLGVHWFSTAAESDLDALAAQAAEYFGFENLYAKRVEQKGNYLALLCSDKKGTWSMCVFDRDAVFQDRWRRSGGNPYFDAGELTSWNFGSPQGEAVLIFCGAALPQEAHWYTFQNSGVSYVCPIEGDSVLDLFVLPDTGDISGSPLLLDSGKQPLDTSPVTYTGGPLLCQSPVLSFLPDDGRFYESVTEQFGGLEIAYSDGRSFSGELAEQNTYPPIDFLLRLPTFGGEPGDLVPDTVFSVEGRTYAGRESGENGEERTFTIWELAHDDGAAWLWLSEGGQENVGRVYELLDLGSFHLGAVEALWTRTNFHTALPLRFEGDFTSAEFYVESGCLSTVAPWTVVMDHEDVSRGGGPLTIAPGDTIYWDPMEADGNLEETYLKFYLTQADGSTYTDKVMLRPVSQCRGCFDGRTCAVSQDWLGLFSSNFHQSALSTGNDFNGLVVTYRSMDK